MRRIAIVNQKGGCGKTTTSINLAGLFARRGLRTLLVDMDPQSHCAAGLAIPEGRIDQDIGDAMLAPEPGQIDPARLLWRVSRNLDLAPSRMKLAGLEASRGGLADRHDKESRLAALLGALAKNYDLCCIDCSPSIGLLTFNALTAASEIIIPVETSYFSLQGAAKQLSTIRSLEKRLGTDAPVWLLPTIHDEASALARDLLEELRRRYGSRVLPTVIRLDPTLKEAASFGQPIAEYSPTSRGAQDYSALADWLIDRPQSAPEPSQSIPETPEPAAIQPPPFVPPAEPPTIQIVAATEAPLVHCHQEVTSGDAAFAQSPPAPTHPTPQSSAEIASPPPAPSPAPPTRAEEMVARARRLISRGEELAQRRAAKAPPFLTRPLPVTLAPRVVPVTPRAAPPTPATAPAAPASSPSLGLIRTPLGTRFVQPLSIGQQVCIAGDFNNWSPVAHRLRANPSLGVHELCIPLPPGKRLYRLVVDGRWTADPFNPLVETNPFGEPNSIAMVPSDSHAE